jgi:hypothetical protein
MPVFHCRVPVINSLAPAAAVNDSACVAIIAVQALVPSGSGADHPDDRVTGSISS